MIKILFLYSEVMGYNIATIKKLAEMNCEVHFIHWDHMKLSKFRFDEINNVTVYKRSLLSTEKILSIAKFINPNITILSGWMDRGYLITARYLKTRKKIVICGIDSQWKNSIKDTIRKLIFNLKIPSLFFSHYWIPGLPQYDFLKKLKIDDSKIIFDGLSADTSFFEKIYNDCHTQKKIKYPHKFFYAGRFENIKGIKTLINSWIKIKDQKLDWDLKLIGNGSQKSFLETCQEVELIDFVQPQNYSKELKDVGCFILPSLDEPWGVVVHEFCCAGLPIILSSKVGAKSSFLIKGFNGYEFEAGNVTSLSESLLKIINSSDKKLYKMGMNSNAISKKMSTESSIANLLSTIKNN